MGFRVSPNQGYLFLTVPIRRLIEFMAQPAQLDGLVSSVRLLLKDLYLEGHGDLVSRLITYITHIITPCIPIVDLVTKSP